MALPDSPLTRGEQYLSAIAGEETALPNVPLTRTEQYLAKIAGQDVAIPNVPLTRQEQYLAYIAENGGGGGGGDSEDELVQFLSGEISTYESTELTTLDMTALSRVSLPNVTSAVGRIPFIYATEIFMPKCVGGDFSYNNNSPVFVAEKIVIGGSTHNIGGMRNLSSLTIVDITGGSVANIAITASYYFQGCNSLKTIILRPNYIVKANGNRYSGTFVGSPFASGGTGGTIYIPKSLYDHLGDGTALDYKADANWATIDGYGTITWAQIEGSEYEHYYADGTPIE